MNSERFEALIDAILAIILTIIVLEIPMAVDGSWNALFEVRLDFIIYALSFIVIFFGNKKSNLSYSSKKTIFIFQLHCIIKLKNFQYFF